MRYPIHRTILLLVAASALALCAAAANSATDGKSLYRNNCKVCHDKGSKNGTYTPMTLTQAQWERFFTTKLIPAHKNAVHPTAGKNILELLTPEQMKAIQRFCVDHAADSEQPATCG
jgi:cytochrome c5